MTVKDNYKHYFIECRCVDSLWSLIDDILRKQNYNVQLRNLYFIVLGYKIVDTKYREFNILMSMIGYTIYKHYHISNRRTDNCSIVSLFKTCLEKKLLLQRYKDVKLLKNMAMYLK